MPASVIATPPPAATTKSQRDDGPIASSGGVSGDAAGGSDVISAEHSSTTAVEQPSAASLTRDSVAVPAVEYAPRFSAAAADVSNGSVLPAPAATSPTQDNAALAVPVGVVAPLQRPAASTKSERAEADCAAPMGRGATATAERLLASLGLIDEYAPRSAAAVDVPNGGVLLALSALLVSGLLHRVEKFFRLPAGF